MCYIENFTGMPTGDIVAHVREGRTSRVNIVSAGSVITAFEEIGLGGVRRVCEGRTSRVNIVNAGSRIVLLMY